MTPSITSRGTLVISRPALRPFGSIGAGGSLRTGRSSSAAPAVYPIRSGFTIGALRTGVAVSAGGARSASRTAGPGRTAVASRSDGS